MNDIFKKAGAGLLILGISFYAITQTITALIPGFFLMILVTSFIYISNYYSEIIK